MIPEINEPQENKRDAFKKQRKERSRKSVPAECKPRHGISKW
jgi:hypothetical protein